MPATGNIDVAVKAMIEEVTRACAAHLGAEAVSAPADVPVSSGWTLTAPVTGAAEGRVVVFFDRGSAAAYARTVTKTEDMPTDETVADLLVQVVREAAAAVSARRTAPASRSATPSWAGHGVSGARAIYVAVPNVASCLIAVGVATAVATHSADDRLGAVLDVDLPLVVDSAARCRFTPWRNWARGQIIDEAARPRAGRSLVGDRIIARGEVVVVGGTTACALHNWAPAGTPARPTGRRERYERHVRRLQGVLLGASRRVQDGGSRHDLRQRAAGDPVVDAAPIAGAVEHPRAHEPAG
jgi:hypothetical protein